jgi:O-antigen ligase
LTPSATSRLCLLLGCGVIAATQSKIFRKRPNLVRFGVPAGVVLYGVLVFFFDLNAHIAEAVGRDPTLTDRTKIWKLLLTMDTNPMLGTGYESFWLGSRLLTVWSQFRGLNEAHNGYLEVYLNLGMVGLLMLGAFLIVTYSRVGKLLKRFESFGSLSLAFWTVLIFYSITEVGFRSGLMWFAFLLGAISLRRAPNDDCRTAGKGGQSRNNARLEASLFTFVPTRDYYGASHPIS